MTRPTPRPAPVPPTPPDKAAVYDALAVLTGCSVADVARRAGVSVSLLYAVRDPARPTRLAPERALRIAQILRVEAARLDAAAARLEAAVSARAVSGGVEGSAGGRDAGR